MIGVSTDIASRYPMLNNIIQRVNYSCWYFRILSLLLLILLSSTMFYYVGLVIRETCDYLNWICWKFQNEHQLGKVTEFKINILNKFSISHGSKLNWFSIMESSLFNSTHIVISYKQENTKVSIIIKVVLLLCNHDFVWIEGIKGRIECGNWGKFNFHRFMSNYQLLVCCVIPTLKMTKYFFWNLYHFLLVLINVQFNYLRLNWRIWQPY